MPKHCAFLCSGLELCSSYWLGFLVSAPDISLDILDGEVGRDFHPGIGNLNTFKNLFLKIYIRFGCEQRNYTWNLGFRKKWRHFHVDQHIIDPTDIVFGEQKWQAYIRTCHNLLCSASLFHAHSLYSFTPLITMQCHSCLEKTLPEYNKQTQEKSVSMDVICFCAAFICENSQLLNSV